MQNGISFFFGGGLFLTLKVETGVTPNSVKGNLCY